MDLEDFRAKTLKKITYRMIRMGFQTRQRGYRYLREAVWIVYNQPETINCITKILYPEVAKRFSTTDKQVERAIRNAIETAWTKGEKETMRLFYECAHSDADTRPTNKEVIETLVGFLKNSD